MIRRLQALVAAVVLLVAAFATGLPFLFYLLYLGILVVGGSYVLTRLGLTDLEAGYAVNQLHGRVGDTLRLTYTLRNAGRLPKVWLEVHNPTNLPGGLAGRALSLGPRGERSWVAKTPLTRRGHFRIEPLQIRTGDPFGLFEASAAVGQGLSLIVYPRVERLPLWRLPAASIEGSHAAPERTLQTTPLATSVRPYAPGDSMNRIHWKSTARHGEIQVKEFDLEQTSDAWIFLDLERRVQRGQGRRVDGRGRRPGGRLDRRPGTPREPRGRADDDRPSDGRAACRPWRPPAPQDHATARRRRRRWGDTPVGGAHRRAAATPPGDDRGRHHVVARSDLDPTARRAADSWRRLCRGRPRRPRLRSGDRSGSVGVVGGHRPPPGSPATGAAATKSTRGDRERRRAAGRATTATMAPTALGAAGTPAPGRSRAPSRRHVRCAMPSPSTSCPSTG